MKNDDDFEVRSYGKGELAGLYLPDINPDSAVRTMRKWIQKFPGLADALTAMGYQESDRRFTPGQVRLIVQALGAP